LKIVILSRNRVLYSTSRLVETARRRGHAAWVVDTLSIPVLIDSQRPHVHEALTSLAEADAVIPRIGSSITFYGLAVVRQLEGLGLLTTASSEAIACSRDKLQSLQIMAREHLPIPRTTIVSRSSDLLPAISTAGGLPVILKQTRGTQGKGVVLARSLRTVASVFGAARSSGAQLLVQEFIPEASATDQRIIVVGGRCIAAMERRAAPGEFRSNLHLGGSAREIELDSRTRALATRAALAHGLDVAGVDILVSHRGPLVLEVNSSPGLEGIEAATEVDIADEIIAHLERRLDVRSGRRQGNLG